ncbi:MAG TPA: glycosyltransferase family 2 protein [Burkholderiales bacterium]|nr:glycosyltransferase family 2 protein [Burkholderiales bacterium]
MISVLIVTKNEAQDLPGCLESVRWCDDVHVYDSFSTDDTVAIARAFGAHVTEHVEGDRGLAFGGDEAAHRNWGLHNLPFRHEWVLQLDADERVPAVLVEEMTRAVQGSPHAAFQIRRRDFLASTWLRHVQATPYYLRLFRPRCLRFERLINSVSIVDGSIGKLNGYFDHFPFSKGISHWIAKHNHYSTLEARQIADNRRLGARFSVVKAFTAKEFHERRYHQKELFYRLGARPLFKFFILFFVKRGFLDGRAGFTYAMLQSMYEYMIVLKSRELERVVKN